MVKWFLSAVAILGLYSVLAAQDPDGGGTGGGQTGVTCGGPPVWVSHPGMSVTGIGTTAEAACSDAYLQVLLAVEDITFDRCRSCPGIGPHCGHGAFITNWAEPTVGPAQFDPTVPIWTCSATLPPSTYLLTCPACDD